VSLATSGYTMDGTVSRIGSSLDRGQIDVLLTQTVDRETAERIVAGDVAQVAGFTTGEVRRVRKYATADPDQVRVLVGMRLETVRFGSRPLFGTTPVSRGNSLTISTDGYTLTAPIERVGSLEQRGTAMTRTVTLRMTEVREEFADALRPGMTERQGTTTVARVTGVDTEPSLIIATGDDGRVNVVDHPFNREVILTTELRVHQTTAGPRFKGDPLRQGSEVVLDLGTVTVRATVVSVGQ
jgi:hypothetical protein